MVQFLCFCVHCWCFWWWTEVRWAHDQSAHMQSHTQQTMMHLYLSEPTVCAMLTHLWNRLIQTFVPCLHQWAGPPVTLSLVHHCFYLGPLLINTDQCRNSLTQSPSQFGPCQTCSNLDTCPLFLLLIHHLWGQNVHVLPSIAHLQTGATMRR